METARRQAQAVVRAADELRKVAPDAGTYVAESSFFERDWQRAYWGRNYPKLQQLKKKYDPGGCSSCITASAARNGAPTASPDWVIPPAHSVGSPGATTGGNRNVVQLGNSVLSD